MHRGEDPGPHFGHVHPAQEQQAQLPAEDQSKSEALDNGVTADLFEQIRAGLALGESDRPQVQAELDWFVRNQDFLDRTFDRARPYLYHIVEEIDRRGLPRDLALLPLVESAFQPGAYSPMKAAGLWQFIPATGQRYGLKQTRWYDGRRDVAASTVAALSYLGELHKRFEGDWLLAIAAYNCGEGLVERRREANRAAGKPTDFWSLDLPQETEGYVPRMIAISMIVADPARYSVRLKPIPAQPYWHPFDVGRQVELATVANALGVSLEEMRTLNPGLLGGVTDPNGPHTLLVPAHKAPALAEVGARLPAPSAAALAAAPSQPATGAVGTRHTVRKGETLGGIADRYNVSVKTLRQANGIKGNFIKVGQRLVVPGKGGDSAPAVARAGAPAKVPGNGTHTVRQGDTLWELARRYGVRVEDLMAWNGLRKDAALKPRQKIVVAQGEARATPVAAAPAETDAGTVSYKVRKGDSLWTIARQFDVRVDDLLEWNKLSKSAQLKPGQQLIVRAGPSI